MLIYKLNYPINSKYTDMPNHLSILGIIHTAISIIAIITAVVALIRTGRIDPKSGTGELYVTLTVVACFTALPIMKTGHPGPGHALAVIILVLLLIAIYAYSMRLFGKTEGYVQTIAMSATLFLSMIPAVKETLTRLPVSHPLADNPDARLVKTGLFVLLILFVAGITYQVIKLKALRKTYNHTKRV
jgi:Ca2+/Na+ antiporter